MKAKVIQESFALLAPRGGELASRFYEELFARYPAVRPLFANVSAEDQAQKLLATLQMLVANAGKPATLKRALQKLGARHQGYGAEPEHYPAVGDTLRAVMRDIAGSKWTRAFDNAWKEAIGEVSEIMLEQYTSDQNQATDDELIRLRSAVHSTLTAIMMVDLDLRITYANAATLALLRKHEDTLRTLFRGFSADNLIGTNIDIFHKNPAHQRAILADPHKLPHSADIHVGPLTFNINVTAQLDEQGNHIGSTLEWYDVTEQRAREGEIARLQAAVNGAETPLMLCNSELDITYVNPAVVKLLSERQGELRKVFPGFDAQRLVGTNIDQFHKNPSHQRALLKDPSRLPAKAQIKVADLDFEVNATAILSPNGEYLGNMVEWKDITEQKDAEVQIQTLIGAAAAGQLEQRIDADRYQGFMKGLAEGINTMLDAIVTPLRESSRVIGRLADGDLTENIAGDFQGEFAALRDAVNTCTGNLLKMVTQIRTASGNINTSASEIAQGNADLSQRTEEQASSLEETASSMEELTGTVRQNADNSRQANQLAAGAREQAERGGTVVGSAINAMAEIDRASKKIADIIGVIDEIAFQTNLLALNAAVEAARAGEQGRGFAVVASEVRNLAQRSAGAAKEIKTLIKDSVDKVDEGTRLVNESGTTLEEIVGSVKKVSDIIAEIAAASEEQSAGIEQINKAVAQMDQVVQQNAALVEEAAAASESMDEQSRGLMELMAFFQVSEAGAVPQGAGPVASERRSTNRPWSQTPEGAGPTNKPAPAGRPAEAEPVSRRAAAAGGGSDDQWEEF